MKKSILFVAVLMLGMSFVFAQNKDVADKREFTPVSVTKSDVVEVAPVKEVDVPVTNEAKQEKSDKEKKACCAKKDKSTCTKDKAEKKACCQKGSEKACCKKKAEKEKEITN